MSRVVNRARRASAAATCLRDAPRDRRPAGIATRRSSRAAAHAPADPRARIGRRPAVARGSSRWRVGHPWITAASARSGATRWRPASLGHDASALLAARRSSVENLDWSSSGGAARGATLRYATPLVVRRARRSVLRALRRREHRPRGDDADGGVLRHLGRGPRGTWTLGLVDGMVAGALFGLLHAFFSIHLRADQIVGGRPSTSSPSGSRRTSSSRSTATGHADRHLLDPERADRFLDEIP